MELINPNPDHVAVLNIVLAQFQKGHALYVCNEITDVAESHPRLALACQQLLSLIERRIAPVSTVISWLCSTHPHLYREVWPEYPEEMGLSEKRRIDAERARRQHEYRVLWIQSLIKELSESPFADFQPKETPT